MKFLSRVQLFPTPWTVACQAPLSIGFSRQEYWSGLPFPSPGDLPNPGIEPESPALQEAITLQYCSGFFHAFTWISHGCTTIPHSEPRSHLPPHPIPQGHPRAPALSTLFHASNLNWPSISHMVIYTFQCFSLKSSHPLLLLHSPKSVLYIWVSYCLAYRVISAIFLNSIYMH